ncbi:MAG: acetate/propionate family kinase, partial [Chloroflexi bacterium]|nr:acetate/propionate family kinase [Chloroflexota bacterium]
MRILAVNCGSSTLKFELFDITGESRRRQARGIVDGVGKKEGAVIEFDRSESPQRRYVGNHREASLVMLARLGAAGLLQGLDGVGHRIVHGGDRFRRTALVTPDVLGAIDSLTELAPLHNQPSLDALHVLMEALGGVPNVAVFDTAFHRTMPDESRLYAIPLDLADRHHVQRYGFHGLAHRYMVERCAALMSMPRERLRIISLQLGNGCSAAAVMGGRSIDTSMGFTPLEGLVMGTRSGDIDPSLAGFIAAREKVDMATVDGWLNKQSGLLGISGRSSDMRELLEAGQAGDRLASL